MCPGVHIEGGRYFGQAIIAGTLTVSSRAHRIYTTHLCGCHSLKQGIFSYHVVRLAEVLYKVDRMGKTTLGNSKLFEGVGRERGGGGGGEINSS